MISYSSLWHRHGIFYTDWYELSKRNAISSHLLRSGNAHNNQTRHEDILGRGDCASTPPPPTRVEKLTSSSKPSNLTCFVRFLLEFISFFRGCALNKQTQEMTHNHQFTVHWSDKSTHLQAGPKGSSLKSGEIISDISYQRPKINGRMPGVEIILLIGAL